MTTIHAAEALLPDGWARDVRIALAGGRIGAVATGVPAEPGDDGVAALLPGMPNLHSHAFQRAMAGLAERRGPEADDFWTWRDTMFRHALRMDPDDVEAVAAQLYVEILEAGFTRVGEFHYLHHGRDGRPYAEPAAMAARIAAAAREAGIGLTLLPVFYARSGFGGAPAGPDQRRFASDLDGFARLLDGSRAALAGLDGAVLGVAPHSLRAATPDELATVAALLPDGPIHIHVAEQTREVEDCVSWSGLRPVAWLLRHAEVDRRWCLVHATHMDGSEVAGLARSGAVAGLCPITEANLGDGTFPGPAFAAAGGAYGIGSDSNVLIGVAAELRQLEYSQRLLHRGRNLMAGGGGSTGCALYGAALAGGSRALGAEPPGIREGAPADLVSLDGAGPALAGRTGDAILDTWIFAGGNALVDRVWVAGRLLVTEGRHVARDMIARRFRQAVERLADA